MSKEYDRCLRVGDQIQRELALIISRKLKDPRLRWATVSHVKVSKDLKHADVYLTSLKDEDTTDIVSALSKASGLIRHELGRSLVLRGVPQLRFKADKVTERGRHLMELIEHAVEQDEQKKRGQDG